MRTAGDKGAVPGRQVTLVPAARCAVTVSPRQVSELTVENDKLRALIQKLLRHRFGRRSEQLSPDQLKLAIEDIEQEIAGREAAEDASAQSEEARDDAATSARDAISERCRRICHATRW